MMKITILCIGKLKTSFLKEGLQEYLKRMTPYATVLIEELNEEKIGDKPSAYDRNVAVEAEGERLVKRIKKEQFVFLLDLHGEGILSEQLAKKIERLGVEGQSDIVFVIGGAFGVAEALRKRANIRISFGKLTYTHQMIRLLLVEQIYRAFKIIKNEPYHW